ncbi:hypothetical protein GBG21_17930 [Aeribacillus pallidus]
MENQLQRGLKERHITLIALGSAIGVGLFLGSSSSPESVTKHLYNGRKPLIR